MSDLPKRLRIKASMIALGERIAWGSDTALMEEAADVIEALSASVENHQLHMLGMARDRDQLRALLTAQPQASAEIPFGGFDPNFCPGSNPDNPQTEEHEPEQPGAAQSAPAGEREAFELAMDEQSHKEYRAAALAKAFDFHVPTEVWRAGYIAGIHRERAAWQRAQSAGVPEELATIGELIRTQDNRCTDQPLFVVMKKREVVTLDTHDHDRIVWVETESGDYCEADERQARRLELLHKNGRDCGRWERYAMKEIDVFVTACFTEQGCKDFLARDGHNHRKPFIYAFGSCRNAEYQAVRNWLASAPAQPAAQQEQHPDDAAVDQFSIAMKAKLAKSREKGRHGWQTASAAHLSYLLYHHMYKADPLDVANLAMMLHQNGQAIELPQEARHDQGEVQRLREALEDGRRAMFAVLNQETKLKAVAKRVLDAEIKRIDAALAASTGQEE